MYVHQLSKILNRQTDKHPVFFIVQILVNQTQNSIHKALLLEIMSIAPRPYIGCSSLMKVFRLETNAGVYEYIKKLINCPSNKNNQNICLQNILGYVRFMKPYRGLNITIGYKVLNSVSNFYHQKK